MNTIIRHIEATDIVAFRNTLDIVCREEIFLCFVEAPPIEKVEEFVLNNIEKRNPQYVVINSENDQLVGWCDIRRDELPRSQHVGHLGMGLLPDYRGKGIGKQLITTTIAAAFRNQFERIELEVYSDNLRAKALYEKVGFQLEGIKRHTRIVKGNSVDSVMMGLLQNEFNEQ